MKIQFKKYFGIRCQTYLKPPKDMNRDFDYHVFCNGRHLGDVLYYGIYQLEYPSTHKHMPRLWQIGNSLCESLGLQYHQTCMMPFHQTKSLIRHILRNKTEFHEDFQDTHFRDLAVHALRAENLKRIHRDRHAS